MASISSPCWRMPGSLSWKTESPHSATTLASSSSNHLDLAELSGSSEPNGDLELEAMVCWRCVMAARTEASDSSGVGSGATAANSASFQSSLPATWNSCTAKASPFLMCLMASAYPKIWTWPSSCSGASAAALAGYACWHWCEGSSWLDCSVTLRPL